MLLLLGCSLLFIIAAIFIIGLYWATKDIPHELLLYTPFFLCLGLLGLGIYYAYNNSSTRESLPPPISSQIDSSNNRINRIDSISSPNTDTKAKIELYKKLQRSKIEGDNFSGTIHLNPELVKGLKGRYYIIDLKNSRITTTLFFKKGTYVIDEFDTDFREGLRSFDDAIIDILDKNDVQYKIFVKGSADITGNTTFKSSFDPIFQYKNITYWQKYKNSKSRFIDHELTMNIPDPFFNKHLPNLRAAFIAEKLNDVFNRSQSIILDGSVSLDADEKDRNAMIFLFLPEDWYKKEIYERFK